MTMPIKLYHNIRGFLCHKNELEIILRIYEYPGFVALTETFLDGSVQCPSIPGYIEIGRRDRGGLRQKGGVIMFVREDLVKYVVHLSNSENHERIWAVIHSDQGPILFGVWYRPASYGEIESIHSLRVELEQHGKTKLGIVLCGDMNVHFIGWL